MNGVNQSDGLGTVIVGVSGSRASSAALRWAADEARRRNARLHVIRSWDREFDAAYSPPEDWLTSAQQSAAAGEGLAAAMRATFGAVIPDGVAAQLAEGTAERTLVDWSADADLLVLGSAAPTAGLVGPVIRACLSHARCPVVVVGSAELAAAPAETERSVPW